MTVLIESDWNLKRHPAHHNTPVPRVLIESDWNLKYINDSASKLTQGRINRIRLEFKVRIFGAFSLMISVLIESDWNLKSLRVFQLSQILCINRIRLEFKVRLSGSQTHLSMSY